MGRRNEHSREQQREMAIAAAELLIVRGGIAEFSMRKVAREIGYTVGQLYLLFRNQDDLFVVLNERTAEAIHAFLSDAIAARRSPQAQLRAAAHAYIAFAQRHPNRWQLMFEHQLPDDAKVPRANVLRVQRLFELIEQPLGAALPRLGTRARKEAATALWSGVHGICVLAVTGKLSWSGVQNYDRLCDLLVDRFIDGLDGK